jgi:hypothetical protein
MIRPNRFTRLVAAGALVASTLAVVGIAPAQAGPGPIATVDSLPNGTATITYSDFTQIEVYIIDGTGEPVCEYSGSAPTVFLHTLGVTSPMAASPVAVDTSTLVGPAPEEALGTGNFYFCVYDVTNSGSTYDLIYSSGTVAIFDQVTASMVDDGNGSLILSFANANADFSQSVNLLLLSSGTTCPENPSEVSGFVLSTQEGLGLSTSPTVIGVGTLILALPVASLELTPLPAGEYFACLYSTVDYDMAVVQSLPIGIRLPTPAPVPTPVPAPVVTPVHAG